MPRKRAHLDVVVDAAVLLGAQIRAGRIDRGWTLRSLAERAQVTPNTIQRAERGDLGVAVGTMLQLAALVGVPLFDDDPRLAAEARASRALLNRRVRPASEPEPDLDF